MSISSDFEIYHEIWERQYLTARGSLCHEVEKRNPKSLHLFSFFRADVMMSAKEILSGNGAYLIQTDVVYCQHEA